MGSMASTVRPVYDKVPSGSRLRTLIDQGTVKGGGPETVGSIMQRGQTPAKKRPMLMDGKKPEKPATGGGDETIGSSGKSLGN